MQLLQSDVMNWAKGKTEYEIERGKLLEITTQLMSPHRRRSRRRCGLPVLLGDRYCQPKLKSPSTIRSTCIIALGVPIASPVRRDWHPMLCSQPTEKDSA